MLTIFETGLKMFALGMEKHRNCPPHIDYTKCAKRCHLEIFSKSTDPLGRKTIYPAVHGGRPARKTYPHRTQSTARRTCCQKISISG